MAQSRYESTDFDWSIFEALCHTSRVGLLA